MNRFLSLVKADFQASFNVQGKDKSGKKKERNTSFKTIMIIVIVLGTLGSTLYNVIFTGMYALADTPKYYYSVLLFTGVTSLLTLSTSVFKVKSIYMGKDYEMLSAMPVTKREIVASKILTLYLVELLYSAIILIPNTIVVTIFSKNLMFIASGLLAVFLAPAIPMMLACFFAMFITLVADRYKFGNIINVIFYIILFACIFFFSFTMNTGTKVNPDGTADISTYTNMASVFAWFNPTTKLIQLAYEMNYAFIILYVAVNILVVLGAVSFLALFFDRVHELATMELGNEVYVAKKLETKSQKKTLLSFETKRFLSSKFYFINSISSGIVAVMMAAFIGYMFSPWSSIVPVGNEMVYIKQYGYCGFVIVAFGIGIATPASVGISIEGNKFWMIKTMPIDYKEYLKAKLKMSFITMEICGVLASIILCVLVQLDVYCYIILPLLTTAYIALCNVISLRINLRKYKLKWKNEQECCKNSSAVVLSMLLDWAIMINVSSVLVGLSVIPVVGRYLSGILTTVGMLIAAFAFYKSTLSRADKYIERIEEF